MKWYVRIIQNNEFISKSLVDRAPHTRAVESLGSKVTKNG